MTAPWFDPQAECAHYKVVREKADTLDERLPVVLLWYEHDGVHQLLHVDLVVWQAIFLR
jgi:hypothetical protein